MSERKSKTPWLTFATAFAAMATAAFTYYDGQRVESASKAELASTDVVILELVQKVARVEAQMEIVLSSSPFVAASFLHAGMVRVETETSTAPPAPSAPVLKKPPRSDPRVQAAVQEMAW